MPYPQNLETARAVEAAVREAGATPRPSRSWAGGSCRADGGRARGAGAGAGAWPSSAVPTWPLCLASGGIGATTVAATMIAAHRAGIAVFATGGIGGVHRGAEESFDISADLRELSETPVTVVAAGAKAILDLPKTLEVLETLGVPVIAVGRTRSPPSGRATAGSARRSASTAPRRSLPRTGCARHSACRGGSWWPTRSRRRPRSPPRPRAPDRGGQCAGRRGGRERQGGDALPAAMAVRAHRGPHAGGQYRPCAEQCPARGADCTGIGQLRRQDRDETLVCGRSGP
jgi:hypothetical protein